MFAAFANGRTVHFRAVGSKATITEIATQIISGRIRHVFVAMDRDLDHLAGSLPKGPGVFVTRGYSWENDVWSDPVVCSTFLRFSTSPEREADARKLIEQEFKRAHKDLRYTTHVDTVLASNKIQLIPRAQLIKIVRPTRGYAPTIVKQIAKTTIRNARRKVRPQKIVGGPRPTATLRDCYGHVVAAFGYHLLVYVLSSLCKLKTTPKELLVPAVIDAFATELRVDKNFTNHYKPLFDAVGWS